MAAKTAYRVRMWDEFNRRWEEGNPPEDHLFLNYEAAEAAVKWLREDHDLPRSEYAIDEVSLPADLAADLDALRQQTFDHREIHDRHEECDAQRRRHQEDAAPVNATREALVPHYGPHRP